MVVGSQAFLLPRERDGGVVSSSRRQGSGASGTDTRWRGALCTWCEGSQLADFLTAGWVRTRRSRQALGDVAGPTSQSPPQFADIVFRNGTIHTMAADRERVEALAVSGTRIIGAGSEAELARFTGTTTRVIDLNGRTVLPGLIDPHHHYVLAALLNRLLLNIGHAGSPTRVDALNELKSAVARTPAGDWVAAGFYDNILQGGDLSIAHLDSISTVHPIFVMYVNGHVGAGNTLAFARAGIGQDTGTISGGGHFGRGPDGRLNGLIYEQPALLRFAAPAVPATTPSLISQALTAYTKTVAAAGNTTLHEPGTIKIDWVDGLAELSNSLDVRLSASFSTDEVEASASYSGLGSPAMAKKIPNSRFSLYGMKFWADGSNQAEMAAQTQPYLNTADKGSINYPGPEMAELCSTAMDAGWSILIHCQGDAAVDAALDAIESAYGANPVTGVNRLEHATMARQDQIERMKALQVEPSFIPDFLHLYGAAYRDQIFGSPRADFMVPSGAAADVGLPFSLHSDAPATGLSVNPLRHVQTAVTRRCDTDDTLVGPDLGIHIDAAMRAVTVNAARHLGLGNTVGTLEKGKEADLSIFEADPYECEPERISAIRVSETWVAGEKKFG